jgi:hypothetical protein
MWRKLMQLLGIAPVRETALPPHMIRETKHLDDQLRDALFRHKAASEAVIKRSLDQVQRAQDVQVALKSIADKIDKLAAAGTIERAYHLLKEDDPPG